MIKRLWMSDISWNKPRVQKLIELGDDIKKDYFTVPGKQVSCDFYVRGYVWKYFRVTHCD